ncbi:MAG: roadblock/LC7 domain-containing protein [Promethearchaeota archaeon]
MNTIKIEFLKKELKKLETKSGVIGTAIVDRNGLLITSTLPRDIDGRKFGANAATIFDAIETAITTLVNKKINSLTVEYNDCQILALSANEQIILVLLLKLDIDMGLIFIEIEETIKNIKKLG